MMKLWALCVLCWLSVIAPASARNWEDIVKSGILTIGVRPQAQLVYRPASPDKPGLSFELAREFARKHSLKISTVEIHSFADYWKGENGTPDIYDKIDIAAEIFTLTPERKKRIKLTPFIENVELFFSTKGSKIRNYDDLVGRSLITYEAMSFYPLITSQLEKRKLPYQVVHISPVGDANGSFHIPDHYTKDPTKVNLLVFPKGTKSRATMAFQPVASKIVDVGINDSVSVLYRVFEIGQFKDILRPLFPARQERSQLAFGSPYEHDVLNKKLEEFFTEETRSERFSKLLEKYIGMSFREYQSLIGMME